MIKRRAQNWYDDVDWRARFDESNTKGIAEFGPIWLELNMNAVATFRNAGFAEQLEDSNKRLASAISATVLKTLLLARKARVGGAE